MIGRRGSVLVESALALTLTLVLLYGALQLGIVGLEQVTVDGGSYIAAHQQSFSAAKGPPHADAVSLANSALTHLQSAKIAFTVAPPPPTSFSGQYGFDTPNARYGGVSLVQPEQSIATATRNGIDNIVLGLTGSLLTVTGTSVEPMYTLVNPHFNLGGFDFGTAAAFDNPANADPLLDNAPPYFVGFNYIQTCPDPISGPKATPWNTCPSGAALTSLGTAEFLDATNWGVDHSINGVTPDKTAVFWEMRYHQQEFANISQELQKLAGAPVASKAAVLDPTGSTGVSGDVACVYSFDNSYTGAYVAGNIGSGDPQFALHPDGSNGPTCPAR